MELGTNGKGGKKPVDSALNLVPFIDLMAVLIVFLIMSAVWTQLNRLQVSQAGSDTTTVGTPEVPLRVRVTARALRLCVGPDQRPPLNVTRDERGRLEVDTFIARLAELKRSFPETAAFTVEVEDDVKYEDLIRVLDAVNPSFPNVSVTPARG